MTDMKEIQIDPEFKYQLEPLEATAVELLERLIVADGRATDPLIVWDETSILIDGHHRHAICTRLSLPFDVTRLPFASRAEALDYARARQVARRNLNANALAYQRGKLYRAERQDAHCGANQYTQKSGGAHESQESDHHQKTADKLAEKQGVSPATIRRDAKFAETVDTLAPGATNGLKLRLLDAKQAAVLKVAKMPEDERSAVLTAMVEDPKLSLKRAVTEVRKEAESEAADAVHVVSDSAAEVPNAPLAEEPPRVEIGGHLLLLGDNNDMAIRAQIGDSVALAFCDPPYNSTDEAWDGDHVWTQDWLADMATIVAVTPGISAIHAFMQRTAMPYRWSTSTWITNGMTRGALGFGNWMYTALFSHATSLHRNRQDFEKIAIRASDKFDDHALGAKRQKPPEYLAWLFGLLTNTGDTILDPFAGSGTSVIVADRLGRRCIAIEKDQQTYQSMVRRVRMAVANRESGAAN